MTITQLPSADDAVSVNPLDFGAIGNGTVDDTAALTAAVAALTPGDVLVIPAGKIITHSTVQVIATTGVTITGGGEVRATAEATSAFQIAADHVTIDGVTFTCPTTTVRGTGNVNHKLVLLLCDGTVLRKVTVTGSSGAGILAYGATNFVIDSCLVQNTRADAYHIVRASSYGKITGCSAYNVGDDCFACVSYSTGGDVGLTHHIEIVDCRAEQTAAGRLFSVIGSQDIEMNGCYGKGSYAAGIIVATETTVPTFNVARVLIRNMDIRDANTVGTAQPDHGAILVDAALTTSSITDVIIENIKVRNTRATASRQLGITTAAGPTLSGIVFDNIALQGTGPTQQFYTNAAVGTYTLFDIKGSTAWGWELIGNAKLGAAAVTSGVITVPAYDELMIVVRVLGMSGADVLALRFNADAGANYWTRFLTSAAGGAALAAVDTVSAALLRLSGVSSGSTRVITVVINNFAYWAKTATMSSGVGTGNAAAAGAADVTGAGEWVNTTAAITSIELRTAGGAVTMNAGSGVMVFGKNFG